MPFSFLSELFFFSGGRTPRGKFSVRSSFRKERYIFLVIVAVEGQKRWKSFKALDNMEKVIMRGDGKKQGLFPQPF